MYPSQSEEIAAESFAAATLAESAPQPSPTLTTEARATQRRWLLAFGLYTVATNTTFSQAVWVLYLAARGYSPFAIGLFETCFHIAKFVAEIPTGIFADLVGRRASLIVSCAVGAVAMLLYLVPRRQRWRWPSRCKGWPSPSVAARIAPCSGPSPSDPARRSSPRGTAASSAACSC